MLFLFVPQESWDLQLRMFGYITCGFPRIFGYVLQVIKYSISVPLDRGGFGGWNLMLTVFFAHSRLFWVICDGSKPACVIQRWLGDVSSVRVSQLYCQIILHSHLFRLDCQIIFIIITLLSNCQYLTFGTCIPTLNKSLLLLFIILPCGIHACVFLPTYT